MRVAVACLVGIVVGFWLDDPADRVETVTVTEEVEVPGPEVVRYERPALPDSCLTYIDRYLAQNEHIAEYSTAVSGQFQNFNDALIAVHSQDIGEINQAITVQHEVSAAATGPLQELIGQQIHLDRFQEQCEREMEELR